MLLRILRDSAHDIETARLERKDCREGVEGDVRLLDELVLFAAVIEVLLDVSVCTFLKIAASESDNFPEVTLILVGQQIERYETVAPAPTRQLLCHVTFSPNQGHNIHALCRQN